MKKRILIITSNYSPEITGIAVYSSDLAEIAQKDGIDVTVLTGMPYYPWWRKLDEFDHISKGSTFLEGKTIIRIDHFIPKSSNFIYRSLMEFSFWLKGNQALRALKSEDFDLVISFMPTVASGILARTFAKHSRLPGIVIFQDISCAALLQSGIPFARVLYPIVKILESYAASWATEVITVSPLMAKKVTKLLKGRKLVRIIYNYSAAEIFEGDEEIRQAIELKYMGKFLLIHSGNIGYKQALVNLVNVAKILEDDDEVHFLVIGNGNQEDVLKRAGLGMKNFEIIPLVSSIHYRLYLSRANVLIINERKSLMDMSLPSKLTSYLAAGKPVIAATSQDSSTEIFLRGSALIVPPENPQALAESIKLLQNDLSLQINLGLKGKIFAQNYLSNSVGQRKYSNLISETLYPRDTGNAL